MKVKSKFSFFILIIAFLLGLTGCKKEEEFIKVAFVAPFEYKAVSEYIENGVLMALEEINGSGGIKVKVDGKEIKRKIKLEYVNDGLSNVVKASSGLRKAIDDKGCQFIIGGFLSKVVLPLMDIMAEKKVLWFGSGGSTPKVVNKIKKNYDKYKYYFRVGIINSSLQGKAIADFAKDELLSRGLKKVAFVSINHAYAKYLIENAKKHMKIKGFDVVLEEYKSSSNSLDSILDKVVEVKADFIVCVFVSEVDQFVTAVNKKGLNTKLPIVNAVTEFTVDDYEGGNERVKWFINLQPQGGPVDLTGAGVSKKFTDNYKKKYNKSTNCTSYPAYDTLYVLKEGIEKSGGSLDADKIIKTLEQDDFYYEHIINYKWHKDNHDLYVGEYEDKVYATINWFQFFDDGKRYCIYPKIFKQRDLFIPNLPEKK